MTDDMVPRETFDEVERQALVNRAKLDRIAALCDGFEADGHGDAVSITAVRAVLAEVTPEPGGDMPSPLTRPGDMQSSGPESYKAGGVLDRDQARTILWDFADQVRQGWSTVNAVHSALDRLAAAVRPAVGGVTLTPEEARIASVGLYVALIAFRRTAAVFGGGSESFDMAERLRALAARLKAAT